MTSRTSSSFHYHHRRRAGFTLLETLLAVGLLAALLAAVNLFVFSMGELWGRNAERRLFDQHVRAVSHYVDSLVREASHPPAVQPGQPALKPQEMQLAGGLPETLLAFELPMSPRLATWPEKPLPDVVCGFLVRDRAGLFLCYHSRLETRFREDPARTVLLSPFVSEVTYEYYQPEFKSWRTGSSLQRDPQGKFLTPNRLRLKFTQGNFKAESVIVIPASTDNPLVY